MVGWWVGGVGGVGGVVGWWGGGVVGRWGGGLVARGVNKTPKYIKLHTQMSITHKAQIKKHEVITNMSHILEPWFIRRVFKVSSWKSLSDNMYTVRSTV